MEANFSKCWWGGCWELQRFLINPSATVHDNQSEVIGCTYARFMLPTELQEPAYGYW